MKIILDRNKKGLNSGHSLAELMVAIAILALIGLALFTYSIIAQRDIKKITTIAVSLKEARIALEYMKKDMAPAIGVVSSLSIYNTGDSEVVLQFYPIVHDAAANEDIADTGSTEYDYIVYRISNDVDSEGNSIPTLHRQVIPGAGPTLRQSTDTPIAKNISNLLFSFNATNLGSIADFSTVDNLKISLSVTPRVTGRSEAERATETQSLTTQVYFRNFGS